MGIQRKFNRCYQKSKMRKLEFTTEHKQVFEDVYAAFMTTPKELDRKQNKLHSKIQDKLDEVSIFKDEDKDSRILQENGGSILLEETEFEFLKSCIEAIKFKAIFSKRVNTMWDFLDSIEEQKLAKVD